MYASHQYSLCVATKPFGVIRGSSWFMYFLVIPLSPPPCLRFVQAKHVKKWKDKTSQVLGAISCFNFVKRKLVKTNGCQSQTKYLAKIFETFIQTTHMLLCDLITRIWLFVSRLLQHLILESLPFSLYAGFVYDDDRMQEWLLRYFGVLFLSQWWLCFQTDTYSVMWYD